MYDLKCRLGSEYDDDIPDQSLLDAIYKWFKNKNLFSYSLGLTWCFVRLYFSIDSIVDTGALEYM